MDEPRQHSSPVLGSRLSRQVFRGAVQSVIQQRSAEREGDPYRDPLYAANWTAVLVGTASAMLFVGVSYVSYLCYDLMRPYLTGISCAMLLSVVFRPLQKNEARLRCIRQMKVTNHMWHGAWYERVVGSMYATRHLVAYEMLEGARFLGLNKIPGLKNSRTPSTSDRKRMIVAFTTVVLLAGSQALGVVLVMTPLVSVGLLMLLFSVFLSEERLVSWVGKTAKFTLISFCCVALVFSFSEDISFVLSKVRSSASSVPTDFVSNMFQMAQDKVLHDIAQSLNTSNVTQTALDMREAISPLVANASLDGDWLKNQWKLLSNTTVGDASSAGGGGGATMVEVATGIAQNMGEQWKPFLDVLFNIFKWGLSNIVNVFDLIYELMLFMFVYRYLTKLPNTLLYYILAKVMSVLNPSSVEARARAIEADVIEQFLSLFQSFWHITWFHFAITFTAFKLCDLPLPALCGFAAVMMALFPLFPKYLSPSCVACAVCIVLDLRFGWENLLNVRSCVLLAAIFLVWNDEWLLAVHRKHKKATAQKVMGDFSSGDEAIIAAREREQLPPFVVGTCIILGLVSYGMRGVVLGPLIMIVARTIFDNFGWEAGTALPSILSSAHHHQHGGMSSVISTHASPEHAAAAATGAETASTGSGHIPIEASGLFTSQLSSFAAVGGEGKPAGGEPQAARQLDLSSSAVIPPADAETQRQPVTQESLHAVNRFAASAKKALQAKKKSGAPGGKNKEQRNPQTAKQVTPCSSDNGSFPKGPINAASFIKKTPR